MFIRNISLVLSLAVIASAQTNNEVASSTIYFSRRNGTSLDAQSTNSSSSRSSPTTISIGLAVGIALSAVLTTLIAAFVTFLLVRHRQRSLKRLQPEAYLSKAELSTPASIREEEIMGGRILSSGPEPSGVSKPIKYELPGKPEQVLEAAISQLQTGNLVSATRPRASTRRWRALSFGSNKPIEYQLDDPFLDRQTFLDDRDAKPIGHSSQNSISTMPINIEHWPLPPTSPVQAKYPVARVSQDWMLSGAKEKRESTASQKERLRRLQDMEELDVLGRAGLRRESRDG
jgi:hypothetical protein